MNSNQSYAAFQVMCAAAMIGWAAAYGYKHYRASECTETLKTALESNQTEISSIQNRTEKIRTREQNLQARAGELIKKLSPADGGAGAK
jgi:hypothetical protein